MFKRIELKLTLLIIALLAWPAFADATPALVPVPTGEPTWAQQLLAYFLQLLIPLVGTALLALVSVGVNWVRTHTKGTAFEHAVSVATEAADGIAQHIKVELLPALQKATAPDSPGGVAITKEERAQLIAQGVSILKASLGPSVLKLLSGVFGSGLDSWLGAKIESAILGQQPPLVAVPPAATPAVLAALATPSSP